MSLNYSGQTHYKERQLRTVPRAQQPDATVKKANVEVNEDC